MGQPGRQATARLHILTHLLLTWWPCSYCVPYPPESQPPEPYPPEQHMSGRLLTWGGTPQQCWPAPQCTEEGCMNAHQASTHL